MPSGATAPVDETSGALSVREFLDELPKTVSGKLLRRELRARD